MTENAAQKIVYTGEHAALIVAVGKVSREIQRGEHTAVPQAIFDACVERDDCSAVDASEYEAMSHADLKAAAVERELDVPGNASSAALVEALDADDAGDAE